MVGRNFARDKICLANEVAGPFASLKRKPLQKRTPTVIKMVLLMAP